MWNGTLYKNGRIGFKVGQVGTGGKTHWVVTAKHSRETLWLLLTRVLFKLFGYLVQIF